MEDELTVIGITLIALTIVIGFIIGGVVANNNDHQFDVKCIAAHKSIKYTTLTGEDSAYKECK